MGCSFYKYSRALNSENLFEMIMESENLEKNLKTENNFEKKDCDLKMPDDSKNLITIKKEEVNDNIIKRQKTKNYNNKKIDLFKEKNDKNLQIKKIQGNNNINNGYLIERNNKKRHKKNDNKEDIDIIYDNIIKNIEKNEIKKNINKSEKKITKITNNIYLKIMKENEINLSNKKYKNKDNNSEHSNNFDYKKLIEEFIKKEDNYKQRIKYLEDKVKNYKKPILVGLNNIGATCYMNATLQCLSNTKKLTEYFLNIFKNDDPNKIMTNEYYKVILNLWKRENDKKSYSPNSFKEVLGRENPLFEGIAANDSKDLINFLLEQFHQELNIINKNQNNNNINNIQFFPDQTNEEEMFKEFFKEFSEKFNSPISNLFYGILETKSQCRGCNIIKYNFQVYSFIEFPLYEVNKFYFNMGKKPLILSNGKNPDVDLYECFEYNRKIDLMNGDNQMYCNNCNKSCDANYSTTIYSYPNYLIINLNRGKGATYECKVIFPEQLNVFNYSTLKQGVTVLELYAVICHLGPSSMSGHFVAYCKNSIDHKWYLYNDAIVSLCTKKYQYNDGMPYILFYKAAMEDT